jgi:hypothetical protein
MEIPGILPHGPNAKKAQSEVNPEVMIFGADAAFHIIKFPVCEHPYLHCASVATRRQ